MEMESEIEWRDPKELDLDDNVQSAQGRKSVEKDIQEQREITALSAIYFSTEHIPPSPSESIADNSPPDPSWRPKPIPLKEVGSESAPIVRFVPSSERSKSPAPSIVDSNILSSLLTNPNILQDLLQKTSTVPAMNSNVIPPPFSFPPPTGMFPPMLRPPFPFPPQMSPFPVASLPLHPQFQPQASGPKFKISKTNAPAANINKKGKLACKYYQAGQPGSCRFGDRCTFMHAD